MDATYGGGGTTPSGDRIIMSGNGANVEGKYLQGGPFTTMSPAISVSAGETFAHELVDHASPFLQGKPGTGYKGINTVSKEMKIPKVITRTHH